MLSTLTLYWATGTATSSLLPCWAYRHDPTGALPADHPGPVPTAIDVFGGEIVPFPKPPRELAERYFNVAAWHRRSLPCRGRAAAASATVARDATPPLEIAR